MSGHKFASLYDLPGLREGCHERDFDIEDIAPHEVTITNRESESAWSLYRVEAWVQIKGLILEDVSPTQALCLSLMRLHHRLLGCRFGMDEDNNLILLADIYPHDQSGLAIVATIAQMQSIVDLTYGLLHTVRETGIAAGEDAIDKAFDFETPAALH